MTRSPAAERRAPATRHAIRTRRPRQAGVRRTATRTTACRPRRKPARSRRGRSHSWTTSERLKLQAGVPAFAWAKRASRDLAVRSPSPSCGLDHGWARRQLLAEVECGSEVAVDQVPVGLKGQLAHRCPRWCHPAAFAACRKTRSAPERIRTSDLRLDCGLGHNFGSSKPNLLSKAPIMRQKSP